MANLLIVEDDDRIAAPLGRTLTREGHCVERLDHGMPAISRVQRGDVDLVLLDLGLPDIDGLDVCRRMREAAYEGGIVILTARDDELDRVVGLDSGADDYLAKPFAVAELLARTRALLRRTQRSATSPVTPRAETTEAPASCAAHPGRLCIDRDARRVWVGPTEVALTQKEFDLLAHLAAYAGSVVTRDAVIAAVWDENWFGSTKMLDTTLGRLRQKLEEAGCAAQIVTVRGVGFRLEGADSDA